MIRIRRPVIETFTYPIYSAGVTRGMFGVLEKRKLDREKNVERIRITLPIVVLALKGNDFNHFIEELSNFLPVHPRPRFEQIDVTEIRSREKEQRFRLEIVIDRTFDFQDPNLIFETNRERKMRRPKKEFSFMWK